MYIWKVYTFKMSIKFELEFKIYYILTVIYIMIKLKLLISQNSSMCKGSG